MAQIVKTMYRGNLRHAERELGWNRKTVAKSQAESEGGFCYIDQSHNRGRKKAEEHLPNLLEDILSNVYSTGVKLSSSAMNSLEQRFDRLPNLGKWFVSIKPLGI